LINDNTAADARDTLGIDISKLVNGSNELVLNSDGSLTIPDLGVIKLGDSKLSLNENGVGSVYLTSTSNDTSALLISDSNVELYAAQDVIITANTTDTGLSWSFGSDGTTTFPNDTILAESGNTLTARTHLGNAFTVTSQNSLSWEAYAEDDLSGSHPAWAWIRAELPTYNTPTVFIETVKESDGVNYRWSFDGNGRLIFPDNSIQTTAYTGAASTGYAITIGDPVNLLTDFRVVTLDADGHAYYCGNTNGVTVVDSPIVIKVDSQGTVLWQRTLDNPGTVTAAFAFNHTLYLVFSSPGSAEAVWNIGLSSADGSIVQSNYYDQGTDILTVRDIIYSVVTGVPQYAALIGTVNTGSTDNGLFVISRTGGTDSFAVSEDGGLGNVEYYGTTDNPATQDVYFVGRSNTYGCIVTRFNVTDGLQWHKNIDLGASNIRATSVVYSNGYIYVVSNNLDTQDDGYLTKLDAITGDMIWQRAMGYNISSQSEPFGIWDGCVTVDGNGDIITAWNHASMFSDFSDMLIVKFDASGNDIWQRSLGTANYEFTNISKSTEYLTADANHYYIALAANANAINRSVGGAVQLSLDGSGIGTYGVWLYTTQTWTVFNQDITAGSVDITSNLVSTIYAVTPSSEQNLPVITTPLDTTINLIGGNITTGDISFVAATMRGPAGAIDNYRIRIQPSASYANTLAVYPTGDDDIHLFEDSDLGGGITLGDYGKSNISVWGNGGTSTTVDHISLSAINDGTITLKTSTNNNNYEWVFNKSGSLVPSEKTVQGHTAFQTITSPTLVLGVNNNYTTITQAPYDETSTGGYSIRIQGQRGYGDYSNTNDGGWGGNIEIFGGLGGETNNRSTHSGGEGGYIKIQSGDGQHGRDGGYLNLQAGDARLTDGSTNNVQGGDVNIGAGNATDSIGTGLGTGGDVNISAGQGNAAGQSGRIQIMTVGGNWQFTQTGEFKNNNSYTKTLETDLQGESVTQVVWTSTQNWVSGAKLLIQVETNEIGDTSGWHSQVCEAIIASRGYANGNNGVGDPVMTVYGVTHTSVDPLVTFTVQRNATTKNIEVVATRTAAVALSSSANLRVYSVETVTRD
jgi:hypothetical protein